MTPDQIDRVFGRGRLQMVTGEHVEVFRESVAPGERRRYTKRFLNTSGGNFAHWTEREWRILARLIGHGISCVPDVVQFDRGSVAGTQLVQTYDAGVTVDQWATLLPLLRDGKVYRHAFEDCAHWWALAHHCLVALKEVHQLQLVHLDIKGDNVCIPLGPATFDPDAPEQKLHPAFSQLALIDFAFALVSRETLTTPLPIGWQREYDYQSPRLLKALEDGRNGDLRPTGELDWRCDMYSLAAMLKRYLPDEGMVHRPERATGWTGEHYDAAKALILTLREHHDRDAPQLHPHAQLIDVTGARLREEALARSLASGWTLARDISFAPASASPLTPMTRLAPSIRVFVSPHDRVSMSTRATIFVPRESSVPLVIPQRDDADRPQARGAGGSRPVLATAAILAFIASMTLAMFPDASRTAMGDARRWLDDTSRRFGSTLTAADNGKLRSEPAAPSTPATGAVEAAPSATAVAPEEPGASTAAPGADAGTQAVATADQVPEPTVQRNRDSSGEAAALPNRVPDAVPPIARTRPKAAPPTDAAARAAAKRASTKPMPTTPLRSSKATASVKSPTAAVPPFAGRIAMQTHRALPTTTAPSATPAQSAELPSHVEPVPAPTQVAQTFPLPSQVAPPQPSSSPAQQPSTPSAPTTPPSMQPVIVDPPSTSSQESRGVSPPSASSTARGERAPSASDDRRAFTGLFFQLFRRSERKPAPIEDRQAQATAPPAPASRPQPKPSQFTERFADADSKVNARPLPPSRTASDERGAPAASYEPQPQVAPAIVEKQPPMEPPVREAAQPAQPEVSPAPSPPLWTPAPRALPPRALQESSVELSSDRARGNVFTMQARRALAQAVPQIAVQAQNEVARVLWAAAAAQDPRQERAVVDAAQAVSVTEDGSRFAQGIEPNEAQRLNSEALQAYWVRRNTAEALELHLKAFGANPGDPEIAGNLAFIYLKTNPVQPETARQLALHAIAVRGSRFRTGRLEDWNTYAVASALTGRNVDARNALFVTVALAGDVERNCLAALDAIANYGERLREPAEAMLYRIHNQGRGYGSPFCAWPRNRVVGMRSQ